MNTLKILGIAAAVLIGSAAEAVDISYETGADRKIQIDQTISTKNSSDQRDSNRRFDSHSDSRSYSSDMVFNPLPIYLHIARQCVRQNAVAADFGLTALMEDDEMVDINRKQSLQYAADSSLPIRKIPGANEAGMKNYISCVISESVKMAQSNLNLQKKFAGRSFTANQIHEAAENEFRTVDGLNDSSLRYQFAGAMSSVQNSDCRFVSSMQGDGKVQCGSLLFSFVDGTIRHSGVLVSPGQGSYGVETSLRVSVSDLSTIGKERANENSTSSSREAAASKNKSTSKNTSSKKSTNISPFLPK